jgi:hypothetical protein
MSSKGEITPDGSTRTIFSDSFFLVAIVHLLLDWKSANGNIPFEQFPA